MVKIKHSNRMTFLTITYVTISDYIQTVEEEFAILAEALDLTENSEGIIDTYGMVPSSCR